VDRSQEFPMSVLAIDPGSERSAFVAYSSAGLGAFAKLSNSELLAHVRLNSGGIKWGYELSRTHHLAIEMIASYGMPVGREVFETCVWIGRFVEAWRGPHTFVYRGDVKLHLCGTKRAKDPNVRAALIDRFGPGRDKAIGTKKQPGPLYGVTADVWAALAVAVTFTDARKPTHDRESPREQEKQSEEQGRTWQAQAERAH
jgi:hypothetical protein